MKRKKKKQPRVIDVQPVEMESTALVVRRPVRQAQPRDTAPPRIPVGSADYALPALGSADYALPARLVDATGRIDIAAYRFVTEHILPGVEARTGIPGLTELLAPWTEHFIAANLPGKNIFKAPKPRRRLR